MPCPKRPKLNAVERKHIEETLIKHGAVIVEGTNPYEILRAYKRTPEGDTIFFQIYDSDRLYTRWSPPLIELMRNA